MCLIDLSLHSPYQISYKILQIIWKMKHVARRRTKESAIPLYYVQGTRCFGRVPTVTHACHKKRLKWVATLPLGDINTETWSSGMGVGRGATTLPCKKENC
jgi:hypothetical protein